MDHRHHAAGHEHAAPTPPKSLRDKVAAAVNKSLGTTTGADGLHDLLPGEGTHFQRAALLQMMRGSSDLRFSRGGGYTGSVSRDVVAERRAKNKRARKARRTNRIRHAA